MPCRGRHFRFGSEPEMLRQIYMADKFKPTRGVFITLVTCQYPFKNNDNAVRSLMYANWISHIQMSHIYTRVTAAITESMKHSAMAAVD